MKPYAVESGHIRELQKGDMEIAQRYLEQLEEARSKAGEIRLSTTARD